MLQDYLRSCACMFSHFSHAQLFETLWTIYNPPGSSVHGILQARILGWVAMSPSVRRLVWAGKHQLGNAAWGASFPSERALPAGGFGSVHTPSP